MRKVKFFACLICFIFLLTTVVPDVFGQTRRKRSRFGRKARTAAIIAGGAGVGALVGGKKGAAIGAGVGGAVGGKRAAVAGAAIGGTGGYLYKRSRARRRVTRRY